MTEAQAQGYSSESTQQELSNEYQHDRIQMFFKNVCVLMLWTKVASALEGLRSFFNRDTPVPAFMLHHNHYMLNLQRGAFFLTSLIRYPTHCSFSVRCQWMFSAHRSSEEILWYQAYLAWLHTSSIPGYGRAGSKQVKRGWMHQGCQNLEHSQFELEHSLVGAVRKVILNSHQAALPNQPS